jgi:hypothetical protein
VEQLVLGIFLLFLCVEELIQSFTVQGLSDSIPAETGNWDLHVKLLLSLVIAILKRSVGTVESDFEHGGGVLSDSKASKTTPKLNVQFEFNFLVFGRNP